VDGFYTALVSTAPTILWPALSPPCTAPMCSLSKYGFWASGVRTTARFDRAETSLLPRFLSSVLKRPSQEVRRELASGERFSGFSASGQSTGLRRKPQETCHSARRSVRRRARLVWELAEEVPLDTNGLKAGTLNPDGLDGLHRPPDGRGYGLIRLDPACPFGDHRAASIAADGSMLRVAGCIGRPGRRQERRVRISTARARFAFRRRP